MTFLLISLYEFLAILKGQQVPFLGRPKVHSAHWFSPPELLEFFIFIAKFPY